MEGREVVSVARELPWFAALKQTSSLGIGAVRNVSGAQRIRGEER